MDGFLEELYENHKNGIFSFLVGMVRDAHVAEDLTQEAFARAFAAAKGFRHDALPKTWLFTIARNLAINHLRSKGSHTLAALSDLSGRVGAVPEPFATAAARESDEAVGEALGRLTPEHREVFLMKVVEGLTYRQIGAIVDCPVGTAQSRFHYAVKRLREMLAREGAKQ